MTETPLYFNGIKPDGSYALPPQTARDLADHILKGRERAQRLSEQLERALKSTDKVLGLVNFLVERSLAWLDGAEVSREAWFTDLARHLLTTLLGSDAAGAGNVRELARKLQEDPGRKIELIVKVFLKPTSTPQELKALLLPQKTGESENYQENLWQLVQHNGLAISRDWLSSEKATELERTPAARAVWLAQLCQQLRELPIESLRMLNNNSNIIADSLKPLVTKLQALPDTGTPWLTQLLHDLDTTPRLWKSFTWFGLIDLLERDLTPIVQAEGAPSASWGPLLEALNVWLNHVLGPTKRAGLVPWSDPLKLEDAGWGIIFPATMSSARLMAIQRALEPLLAWRKKQAGDLYRVFDGKDGYAPGEDARTFLRRFHADPSHPANPKETGVPYYLLLVGSPEEIPFEFQYGLDVQYAVGRIDFDTPDDYGAYARSVVAAEQEAFRLAPEAIFFPVANPGDEATALSAGHLIKPVAERVEKRLAVARAADKDKLPAWNIRVIPPEQTTRAALLELLQHGKAPALLFTASHGMQFDPDDPAKQRAYQGALVCADWRGPGQPVSPDCYLSGETLAAQDDVNLLGSIAFLFACYGAGTPRLDDYYRQAFMDKGEVIAEQPFIAALPKAMLSLARGGALAVVGHIERVWSLSYLGPEERRGLEKARRDEHLAVFESAVDRLLHGYPVGAAMDYFGSRYAALSTELTAAFDAFNGPDEYQLAELWTANHDARGYIILGDPAVRLKVAQTPAEATPRQDLSTD
ncbi:MAG TPA: hypothetical protein PLJ78_07880 [Anaerolineae bacterium]|nr:hypothetical protein [Anaerolineae bacterium]HQK13844.1 hypothetical protein [Anaerolineae bacterium]